MKMLRDKASANKSLMYFFLLQKNADNFIMGEFIFPCGECPHLDCSDYCEKTYFFPSKCVKACNDDYEAECKKKCTGS